MEARGFLEVQADVEFLHIRNGLIIDRRYSAGVEPTSLRGIRDPWYKRAILEELRRDIFDPGVAYARRLLRRGPFNIVTSAGVNYLADAFAGTGAPNNFNYHAFGTGTESGGTQTLSGGSITNATPQVVTTPSAHGLGTNDIATIAGVTTDTSINANWQITVGSPTTFTCLGSTAGGVAGVGAATYQRLNGAGDTVMVADSGVARVAGTQTWPGSVNQYRTVATMSFVSSLAIVEWGLFSASTSGTLWDRRWFNTAQAPQVTGSAALVAAPVNVQNGDSIQATYTLTINAGGS